LSRSQRGTYFSKGLALPINRDHTPADMHRSDDDSPRLIELETKIAYQDKTIAELNQVVVQLNKELAEYARRLQTVEKTLRAELERRDMPLEKPPHY
jgi:SlyX protein